MKEIFKEHNIWMISKTDNYVAVAKGEKGNRGITLLNGRNERRKIDEAAFRLYGFSSSLLLQNEESGSIKLYNNDEVSFFIEAETVLIRRPNNQLIVSKKEKDSYVDFIIRSNLNLQRIPFFPSYANGKYAIEYRDKQTISVFDLDKSELLWQDKIKYNNAEVLIDSDLMSDSSLLFIPLQGGKLIALNTQTGEKVWMLEHNISGQYAIYEDKIYKKNKFLFEIDAKTGKVLRELDIENNELKNDFMSLGPIWVYDDIIVLPNVLSGEIVLLNRIDFSVFDIIEIGNQIANNRENIIWYEGKLYVLDMDLANPPYGTLHVFE